MAKYAQKMIAGTLYEDGVEVPQDDRDPSYQRYLAWLLEQTKQPQPEAVELLDDSAEPRKLTPSEELAAARAWGVSVVDTFMEQALASGVNDAGLAGPLFGWLAGVSAALSSGALHAAEQLLGELLKTPEELRPARPYSDDVALVPIHELLRERLALSAKGER